MANEVGLMVANEMHDAVAGLVKSILDSLKDDKISPSEWIRHTLKAGGLANTIIALIQDLTHDEQAEVLYVFTHSDIVVTDISA